MGTIWNDLVGAQVRFVGSRFRTRVIEAGEHHDELLILIHGNGGHAEAYSRNVVRLGERFHTVAIDLLWHGLSSKPAYERPLPMYAEQLADLIEGLGYERAHIEGESLGGWVTMWTSLHHPEIVDRVVLNTPAGVRFSEDEVNIDRKTGRDALRARSLAALADPSADVIRKRLEWLMKEPSSVTDELVDTRRILWSRPDSQESLRSVFENSFGAGLGEEYRLEEGDLGSFPAPALVLWTDGNPGVGVDAGRRLADLIPDAEFAVIEDAGHWPQWEQPEDHDRVVGEFLSKRSRGGQS